MNLACLRLVGGPFDGHEAAGLPPNTSAPAQIVWSGWIGGQFTAWLYEWHGETSRTGAFVEALIYRPTGRRLTADEIPPIMAEQGEVWADGADMIARVFGLDPEQIWPGL